MIKTKSLADVATTPYKSHLVKLIANLIYFIALLTSVIVDELLVYQGAVYIVSPIFSIFTIIAGVALFCNIIKLDIFILKLNADLRHYFCISWICVGLSFLVFLLYSLTFNSALKILAIVVTALSLIISSVFEFKTHILLKNEKDYLVNYSALVMAGLEKHSTKNKVKDKEGALDLSTLALIGYLILFVAIRAGLSLIRRYILEVSISMLVLLVFVFIIQYITCKRIYEKRSEFSRHYWAFVYLTLFSTICAATTVIIFPVEQELVQWVFTILASIAYAPFYLSANRAWRYINAVRISVYLSLLDESGDIRKNLTNTLDTD
ncbi:MAG: hypothetical protein LBF68_06110 [Christensenellaceae bacterium]|jgi:hypothetical protein|nr:hypothetical protein [Christensenellaceae bacterium]